MKRSVFALAALLLFATEAEAQDSPTQWSEASNELPVSQDTAAGNITVGNETLQFDILSSGEAVVEGDMVIGDGLKLLEMGKIASVQSVKGTSLQGLFRIGNYKWPNGVVLYNIDPKLPDKQRVANAMNWWKSIGIKFKEVPPTDRAYVRFVPSTLCQSSVGYTGGRQTIQLTATCTVGNVAHEIGHALGNAHEQMRSDRDKYVIVYKQNIKEGKEGNFEPKSIYKDIGSYCFESIFHYPSDAFAKAPGLKTIVAKNGEAIGQRKRLAACDIKAVKTMYGLP